LANWTAIAAVALIIAAVVFGHELWKRSESAATEDSRWQRK
jgi:hypothetical protein